MEVFSPFVQGSLYSMEVAGGCAKMARELNWNSQNLPPTRHSLMKASVLLSLATPLHVRTVVKLLCHLPWLIYYAEEHYVSCCFLCRFSKNRSVALDKGIFTPLTCGNPLENQLCRSSFLKENQMYNCLYYTFPSKDTVQFLHPSRMCKSIQWRKI